MNLVRQGFGANWSDHRYIAKDLRNKTLTLFLEKEAKSTYVRSRFMFSSKELLNEQKNEIGIDQPGVIKCFLVLGQL